MKKLLIAVTLLAACNNVSPASENEMGREALELFRAKRIYKDPDSNLCLIVLSGTFAGRPILETHLERCKSLDHLLKPAAE